MLRILKVRHYGANGSRCACGFQSAPGANTDAAIDKATAATMRVIILAFVLLTFMVRLRTTPLLSMALQLMSLLSGGKRLREDDNSLGISKSAGSIDLLLNAG